MRPSARLLASFAAGALVAVPGLAVAQGGLPFETPPVEAPPSETPPSETPTPEAVPPVELPAEAEDRPTPDDLDDVEEEEVEVEDTDDAGHGEWISALAECLPSGRDLHGTGFTKGHVISQAASTGEVVLGEGDEALPVTSVAEAEALCAVVQDLADQSEAPETAQGRPDWAGPQGEGPEEASGSRPGPPAHANAGGNGR